MSINELTVKARDLKELKRMKEDLEAEISSIEDEIKAYMTAEDTDTVMTNEFRITWKPVTTQRLDTKALTEYLGKDCLADFYRITTVKRFSIN